MEKPATPPAFAWIYWLAGLVSVALGVIGVVLMLRSAPQGLPLIVGGIVGLVVVLSAWPIAEAMDFHRRTSETHQAALLESIQERLQQVSVMLNVISEQQLISDTAKKVAFREKDRETVRRAVREEIARQDWEAAMILANDIETQFGYKQEAERFREEITRNRADVTRRQITEQRVTLEKHVKNEAWGPAFQEAQRVMALFPGEEAVKQLPQEIENLRQNRKKQLLDSFADANTRRDTDGAIEILKKLDQYLTPSEAQNMEEAARGIFKEKLNLLRTQFSLAVQDHKWDDAKRIGDEIISDFPNTRMAQEVAEKMDFLRQRATAAEPAAANA
jgi:hypothetical protein